MVGTARRRHFEFHVEHFWNGNGLVPSRLAVAALTLMYSVILSMTTLEEGMMEGSVEGVVYLFFRS